MKIIAPVNNKGGVGKTKITSIISEYFSRVLNQRVLAIDFDPQCNFSQRYLRMEIDPASPEGLVPPIHPDYDPDDPEDAMWSGRSSIADIFFGEPVIPYKTKIPNLEIAPGNAARLLAAEEVRRSEVVDKVHNQLYKFLSSPEVRAEYDVVVIDTAPSKGPLTIGVIKAATHIIIPSVMEVQPIQGIYGMLQLWMQESLNRPASRPLELIGILPNMFRSNTTLHQDMLAALLENPAVSKYVLPMRLGHRIVYAELDSEEANPQSVLDLPASNEARKEVMELCKFIKEKVTGHVKEEAF